MQRPLLDHNLAASAEFCADGSGLFASSPTSVIDPKTKEERRSLPFTIIFQGFMILALTAIVATVLSLYKSVSTVATDAVLVHILETATDESIHLVNGTLHEIAVATRGAADTDRVTVFTTSNDVLARHAASIMRLYRGIPIERVYVANQASVGFCVAERSVLDLSQLLFLSCAIGDKVANDSRARYSWTASNESAVGRVTGAMPDTSAGHRHGGVGDVCAAGKCGVQSYDDRRRSLFAFRGV
jgi:hypothetical protein